MEHIDPLLEWLGMSVDQFLMLSGVVFLIIEAFKKKFAVRLKGIYTDILTIVIAGLVVYASQDESLPINWIKVGGSTLLIWILPAGFHKLLKERTK